MSDAVAQSLALLESRVTPPLFPPSVGWLRTLPGRLGPEVRIGFECRLDAPGNPGVSQLLVSDYGRARFADTARARAAQPGERSAVWRTVERAVEWARRGDERDGRKVTELWIEYDDILDETSPPSLYCAFGSRERGNTPVADDLASAFTHMGSGPVAPAMQTVSRAAEALGGRLAPLAGVMLGRSGEARLQVRGLAATCWGHFLARTGWPGDPGAVREVAARLGNAATDTRLALTIRGDLLPRLGVEVIVSKPGRSAAAARERVSAALIAWLPECRARIEALDDWRGVSTPADTDAWPDALLVDALRQPAHRFGVLRRSLNHFTVTVNDAGAIGAKAYLGYEHVWLENVHRAV